MTNYLFPYADRHELEDRRFYLQQVMKKGHSPSMAMAVWAGAGSTERTPDGWPLFAVIGTHRGEPEIQGPFKNLEEAVTFVNGSDLDGAIFGIDPDYIQEFQGDAYITVRIVRPAN